MKRYQIDQFHTVSFCKLAPPHSTLCNSLLCYISDVYVKWTHSCTMPYIEVHATAIAEIVAQRVLVWQGWRWRGSGHGRAFRACAKTGRACTTPTFICLRYVAREHGHGLCELIRFMVRIHGISSTERRLPRLCLSTSRAICTTATLSIQSIPIGHRILTTTLRETWQRRPHEDPHRRRWRHRSWASRSPTRAWEARSMLPLDVVRSSLQALHSRRCLVAFCYTVEPCQPSHQAYTLTDGAHRTRRSLPQASTASMENVVQPVQLGPQVPQLVLARQVANSPTRQRHLETLPPPFLPLPTVPKHLHGGRHGPTLYRSKGTQSVR
jgi:hypothetical protein